VRLSHRASLRSHCPMVRGLLRVGAQDPLAACRAACHPARSRCPLGIRKPGPVGLATAARRSPRTSPLLTGLRPSPTSHAVVTWQFPRRLTQGPAVSGADRRHPLRLDMLTMTRSASLQVRCAVVAQMERAVPTLHRLFGPPRAKLDSKFRLRRTEIPSSPLSLVEITRRLFQVSCSPSRARPHRHGRTSCRHGSALDVGSDAAGPSQSPWWPVCGSFGWPERGVL
jgi:hypothetical protein